MAKTIREELKDSYLAAGGLQENLTNDSQTIQGMIHAKNNLAVNKIGNVTVTPRTSGTVYGHDVEDLQKDVVLKDGKFTGTLKYVSEGSLPTTWGAGNFLAFDLDDEDSTGATYKVGLYPSEGSGFVEFTPPDHETAFKITSKAQELYVFKTVDGVEHTQRFDLSGLVLEPAPADE